MLSTVGPPAATDDGTTSRVLASPLPSPHVYANVLSSDPVAVTVDAKHEYFVLGTKSTNASRSVPGEERSA